MRERRKRKGEREREGQAGRQGAMGGDRKERRGGVSVRR